MAVNKTKVFFELPENIDDAGTESLWARATDGGNLILENVPFHVPGVSLEDEITYKIKDDVLYFDKIVKKGGHSTYRILQLCDNPKENFDLYWKPIQDLGGSYESKIDGSRVLYAIDIPPEADISRIYQLMEK